MGPQRGAPCLIRQMWSRLRHVVRNVTATALAVCITVALGCKARSARPPEHTASAASPGLTSAMPASDCVRDPRVTLRKLRDRKPELSDLRDTQTHGGVLIFDIRIDPSGTVADVRLAKSVDQQPPWPTLAERWRTAIADWRYEPPTLDTSPSPSA